MTDTCSACLEPFTKDIRRKIQCLFCPAATCKNCVSRYLLTTYSDPHCMECKKGWNREFIDTHLTKAFRTGDLKKHRAKILMEREKAFLPAYQTFVEGLLEMRRLEPMLNLQQVEYGALFQKSRNLRHDMDDLSRRLMRSTDIPEKNTIRAELKANAKEFGKTEAKIYLLKLYIAELRHTYNRAEDQYMGINQAEREAPREFIQRCPAEDCRGYLSTAYKCGICSQFTCPECLVVKGNSREVEHTCQDEAKASAALIRRETHPCPRCGVRIFKIDGCDQMWCTQEGCETAFSWNTGKIITGTVHNPHYYEYLRRQNNGVIRREPGDLPCGDLMQATGFFRLLQRHPTLTPIHVGALMMIHRLVMDILHERLPQFPAIRPEGMNRDINIDYLMKVITEVQWRTALEQRDTKFEKKKEIGQILQMFTQIASERLRNVDSLTPALYDIFMKEVNDLRLYTNKCLVDVGKRMICAIPQIDRNWEYIPPRKKGLNE